MKQCLYKKLCPNREQLEKIEEITQKAESLFNDYDILQEEYNAEKSARQRSEHFFDTQCKIWGEIIKKQKTEQVVIVCGFIIGITAFVFVLWSNGFILLK